MEEFVLGTVHRGQKRLAATKDVPTMHRKEEFVSNMEPRRICAVMKDVPIKQGIVGYVADTVQRRRNAVMKDVPIMYIQEEFVEGTVPKLRHILAVMKDVSIR